MHPADLSHALAVAIRAARVENGDTVEALATRAGVSRAMISKIERNEAQPTAALLSKLATALGITLSGLIARAEGDQERLLRRADQHVWTDPDTGYVRRAVSPRASSSVELVDVELPGHSSVSYPAEAYRLVRQQIWVLAGRLQFTEGTVGHQLDEGDCLLLGDEPVSCTFHNPTSVPCRYLVVLDTSGRARPA